ncbi:MAG TPA: hypothetical protein VLE53_03310 [Gemmatimonadaceae bacterium]|nr:hypothetical protein [Gemmatimonadaceae bacterium]
MQPPVSLVRRVAVAAIGLALIVALVRLFSPDPAGSQPVPTLTVTRDLRIDAAVQDLSPINWMAVAPNGTIAVSQFQDSRVAFFDADGKPLGTFGRSGDGPGEFRRPASHGWLGDTLWVSDPGTRRVTLISPQRELLRTLPWANGITFDSTLAPPPQFFWVFPRALYPDGSSLVDAMVARDSPPIPWPGPARDGNPLVRISASGRFQRILMWTPDRGCSVSFPIQGGSGFASIPFCTIPLTDLAPDGSRFALATAEDVDEREGFYRVLVVRASGDTVFNTRHAFGPVAIPERMADSVIAQRLSRNEQPEFAAAWRSMKLPASFPPLDRVLLGRDETTWIEHYTFSGNRTWSVLDHTGQPIGWLVIPRDVRIQQAARDTIWAIETDDDGLQHIVRFRVTSARGS